ncbi:MAG: UDP-glucose dehydrogenase family protein [Actinomycetota bacterium]
MKVGVIGTGHVGLITCVSLTALGHDVVGTDQDGEKVDLLSQGAVPFYEPGVKGFLRRGLASGKLRFTTDPAEAIEGSEAVLISVGTPPRASGDANLVAVERAAKVVARHADGSCVVIEKSTVPTGTAHRLRLALNRENGGRAKQLEVVSNPEFLREGKAMYDALHPDRILIGAESEWAFETMRRLYEPLISRGCNYIETDIATAELAKHASNAFLALKISYANALARLCERAGADVVSVVDVMGTDPRIGKASLNAGLGYGGSCFPKDLQAFHRLAARLGYDFPLLNEIRRINDETVDVAVEKVREAVWNLEDKRVALFGLAFKPGTDDVRFAPALALAKQLLGEEARVVGYDPQAGATAKSEVPDLEIALDPYEAARGAHCLVLCTEWDEFGALDWGRIKELMAYPVVVDGRNYLDSTALGELGFSYYPMGRPAIV